METITLNINGDKLVFDVTTKAYDKYINDFAMNDKIVPAKNFLNRTCKDECKDALKKYMNMPGVASQLAMKILDEFTPEVEITVGE